MKTAFEITLQTRKILYNILEKTPKEQLLRIPDGYRNNIWWNIAHVVATQQALLYKLSGLQIRIPQELMDNYKKGTVPDGTATDEEIKMVSGFLFSTVAWAQEDYENGLFKNFNEYPTSAKITLHNIEEATTFNLYHEGLHLGVILSLQKALQSQA